MTTPNHLIIADVPCTACGYNLRTLPTTANCPECCQNAHTTLETTLLRWSRNDLNTLAAGTTLAAGLNVTALVGTLVTILLLILMATGSHGPGGGDPSCFLVTTFAGYTLIAIIHMGAAFQYTAAPSAINPSPQRKTIRVASAVFVLATLVPLIAIILAVSNARITQEVALTFLAAWTLLLPSLPIFVFATGRHFANLCQAAGLHTFVPWHHRIANTFAAGVALMNAGFAVLLIMLITYSGARPPEVFLPLMAISVYGGLLIAGIGFLAATFLLFRTARAFRRLAESVTAPLTAPAPPAA